MGVIGIGGQDPSLHAAQSPDPRSRTAKTQQNSAAPVARLGPRPKEEQVPQAAAKAVGTESLWRAGTRMHIDAASKRIIAQIVDENNEVIKQIPPEELLKIAATFQEVNGKLFDRKV
ncbi:MAG: flagellar protein FlaG [Candidatus Hydrogenedentes bacterium]|nr:flagellar protein FlaG [Candidatus Hydrogenedentota bacterium]